MPHTAEYANACASLWKWWRCEVNDNSETFVSLMYFIECFSLHSRQSSSATHSKLRAILLFACHTKCFSSQIYSEKGEPFKCTSHTLIRISSYSFNLTSAKKEANWSKRKLLSFWKRGVKTQRRKNALVVACRICFRRKRNHNDKTKQRGKKSSMENEAMKNRRI